MSDCDDGRPHAGRAAPPANRALLLERGFLVAGILAASLLVLQIMYSLAGRP